MDSSLYRSTDSGASWELQVSVNGRLRDLSFTTSEDGTFGWAVGDNGTILKYKDDTMSCLLGDVNMDMVVTPGDALCAFQIYLNGGTPPQGDCDTECALQAGDIHCTKNGITPGDALYIFQAYLDGKNPPLDCDPSNFDKKITDFELSLSEVEFINEEDVLVSILVNRPEGLTAFGLDLGYPDELLSFVKVSGTNLTENWQALDGKENVSGTVTIGGFNQEAINSDKYGALVRLNFKMKTGVKGSGDLWLFNLTDDLAGAEVSSGSFSTNNQAAAEIPTTYALEQNYPNPFNPTTTIRFALPQAGFVTLEIYNTTGRKIEQLINDNFNAGVHFVSWNAQDLANGVYFYKIYVKDFNSSGQDFVATKKLILLK